ncbi:MAG: hypothetical protein ACFE0J_21545 [Elainellaceae cyanobacterium]
MPDFSFDLLRQKLPTNAIVSDGANSDVVVSLKALMGESSVGLTDTKVGEAVHKLLLACQQAQSTHNETATPAMNAFPTVTPGTARQGSDGNWYSTFNHTVAIRVPLDPNAAQGSTI